MLRADGLLVLQAANCNAQVPAKLYEYLNTPRPLLVFTDTAGDTAAGLRDSGSASIARPSCPDKIPNLLARFISGDRWGMVAAKAAVGRASRLARTEQLGRLLDRMALQKRQ